VSDGRADEGRIELRDGRALTWAEYGDACGRPVRRPRKSKTRPPVQTSLVEPPPAELVAALKSWRLTEARRRRVPAFRILSDRTLLAIAAARPRDEDDLYRIGGMGPRRVEAFGQALLGLVRSGEP